MTKHILTIELKGNNTYHGMSHSWVYEESVTLYFGLFEKLAPNTLFKDNISFELESLYFHYLYQLILIAEWKLYETACGGGVKTWPWRFWKHYYYSIDIQLDKEKEIYLMFLKLETDKKQRKNMSTYTCKLSLQQQNFQKHCRSSKKFKFFRFCF